jgi:hypothetical protein
MNATAETDYAAAREVLREANDDLAKAIATCESLSARCEGKSNAELEPMHGELVEALKELFRASCAVEKAHAVLTLTRGATIH